MKKLIALLTIMTVLITLTAPLTASASTINTKDYVTYEYTDTGSQLIVTLKNVSTQTISLTVTPLFLDSSDKEIIVYSKDIVTFEPGRTAVKVFDDPVGYKKVSVSVTVSLDYYLKGIGCTSGISQSRFIIPSFVDFVAYTKNNSGCDAKLVSYTVLFYRSGSIVKAYEVKLENLDAEYSSFTFHDDDFACDNFKIVLNEAFY